MGVLFERNCYMHWKWWRLDTVTAEYFCKALKLDKLVQLIEYWLVARSAKETVNGDMFYNLENRDLKLCIVHF